MKIDVVYTCVSGGAGTLHYISRFVATRHAYAPGADHRVIPVYNGKNPPLVITLPFSGINGTRLIRENDGWDIGGYIEAAKTVCQDSDIMVCLGESVYFHRHGWLEKIDWAWKQNGPGMYGMLSSNLVRPHLQTTAFVTSPRFLREYPQKVITKEDRYGFEHGSHSFMNWIERRGYPVRLVTFDGTYSKEFWRFPNNINWKGDQSNCLVWCNHTDNYLKAPKSTKDFWEKAAKG